MANTIVTVPGLEIFTAEIEESCPILEDCRSTQEGLKGRQGGKLKVVIPDPGKTVTTKGRIPTIGANGDIQNNDIKEFEREFTVCVSTNSATISSLQKVVDIDSFEREVANPRSPEIGSSVQETVIDEAALYADSVFVVDGTSASFDGYGLLSDMAGSLQDSRCGGELVGYMSGRIKSKIAKGGLSLFNQEAIAGELYRKAKIGEYSNVMWKNTPMPVLDLGAAPASTTVSAQPTEGSDTIVLASTNITTATVIKAGSVFTVANVQKCDVLGHEMADAKVFVVQADATGGSGTISLKVGEINAVGAHRNVSALPAASAAVTWLHTANKKYALVWAWQKGNVELSPVKLDDSGLEEISAKSPSGKLEMSAVVHGDVNRNGTYRFDTAYLTGAVDSRRVALGYIQLN